MRTYYVYILHCADNTYYVGLTNNIIRRMYEHQDGFPKKSYTFSRRPVKLVFQQQFNDINLAYAFEKKIKSWSAAKKDALIKGKFQLLPDLSRKKFK